MAHDVISTCPVCSQELAVTRLACRACGTTLDGDFRVGRFGRLTREQLDLLESFLRSRGNLREMERESGLSYPTLRGRVDALIRALGLGEPPPDADDPVDSAPQPEMATTPDAPGTAGSNPDDTRREILERLARHELRASEAAQLLRHSAGPNRSPER